MWSLKIFPHGAIRLCVHPYPEIMSDHIYAKLTECQEQINDAKYRCSMVDNDSTRLDQIHDGLCDCERQITSVKELLGEVEIEGNLVERLNSLVSHLKIKTTKICSILDTIT